MKKANLSSLVNRISGPAAGAWDVGDVATKRIQAGEDIIHLGVGDPDLDTPDGVRDAAIEAIRTGKTHYSLLAGEPELRAAVAEHAMTLYGGDIKAENTVIFSGTQGALFASFLCLTEAGDEVIVPEPFYPTYPAVVTAGGATMVSVVFDKSDGYMLNPDKIKAAVTTKTKAIVINSPNNPTGAVFDQQSLVDLARFCHENSIWLVSDEVYWSVTYDGEHTSAYIPEQYRSTTIVVNSLSKSHAMTGWRVGWAIGPDEFTVALTALSQALQFGVNQFVQTAAVVALKDTVSNKEYRDIFRVRRNALCDELKKSNHLNFAIPRGGMFALVDISATGLSGKEFAEMLLAEEDIATVPGFGFGPSADDTVRIGFLCDEERVKTAGRRIVRFTENKMREKAD